MSPKPNLLKPQEQRSYEPLGHVLPALLLFLWRQKNITVSRKDGDIIY
jgi:hypothetical protein